MRNRRKGKLRRPLVWVVAGVGALLASPVASAGAVAASGPVPAMASATVCSACGHNLIANAGAEAGKGANGDVRVKVPDWKQTKGFTATLYSWAGGDLSSTTPGPKNRGKNYFYGGPSNAKDTGTQERTVAASGIKTGKVHFTLSGWLGGFASQGDHAILKVSFETAKSKVLSTAAIGPVTEAQRHGLSELLFRSKSGMVPAGTRKLVIRLTMVRDEGSDNDGLADNLSLVFSLPKTSG
jgi:hypothetical protein